MMPKCKHERYERVQPAGSTASVHRCLNRGCNELLSLGQANVTPAVMIEIRAAELAGRWGPIGGFGATRYRPSDDEIRGWSCAESSMADHTDAWLAGYLAHCIVTHRDGDA
jgi:hypothetical protein